MRSKKRIIAVVALALVVVMLVVTLAACGPTSVDAAVKKMEKKNYVCSSKKFDDGTAGFTAVKSDEVLYAYLYTSTSDAKAAVEKYNKSSIRPFGEATQAGKWMVFGTKQAVKDFK